MKTSLFVLCYLTLSCGASFPQDTSPAVFAKFQTIADALRKNQVDHPKDGGAKFLNEASLYYSSLTRDQKIMLLRTAVRDNDLASNIIGELSVIDGVRDDDAMLIQFALESCFVQGVQGFLPFEYLAINKNGKYVTVILSAHLHAKSKIIKKSLIQGLLLYFTRAKSETDEQFVRRCIDAFFNNKMWDSDIIKKIKPMADDVAHGLE